MKIAPLADVKARLVLAHSPRFQAILHELCPSLETGKGLTQPRLWNAVAERRHDQRFHLNSG